MILRLSGHPSRAGAVWREGLEWARHLRMPYEQALLHLEIGRHAEVGGAAGTVHLECAGEILTRLGAASDLARLAAIKDARRLRSGTSGGDTTRRLIPAERASA